MELEAMVSHAVRQNIVIQPQTRVQLFPLPFVPFNLFSFAKKIHVYRLASDRSSFTITDAVLVRYFGYRDEVKCDATDGYMTCS
jgi:hypothetical protein